MRVEYTLTADELQAIINEGLTRRGLMKPRTETTVEFYHNTSQIRGVYLMVRFNAAFPKPAEEPSPNEGGKPPKGPRTDMERLAAEDE